MGTHSADRNIAFGCVAFQALPVVLVRTVGCDGSNDEDEGQGLHNKSGICHCMVIAYRIVG